MLISNIDNYYLYRSENIFNALGLGKFRRTHLEVLGAEQNYGKNAVNQVGFSVTFY